ncbi:MAG: hypothetical protein ACE14T_10990 [Syntrophales bacterium]
MAAQTGVSIRELIDYTAGRLGLELRTGEWGLDCVISSSRVARIESGEKNFPGGIYSGAVLVVGKDAFLEFSDDASSGRISRKLRALHIPCIVFAEINFLPGHLVRFSEESGIPLLTSGYDEFVTRSRLIGFLRERIDGLTILHGVFIRVFGTGIVMTGKSGAGKTECALELVRRGHKLISDDIVEVNKGKDARLRGGSPAVSRDLVYIKGVGLIDVKEIYGGKAVQRRAPIDIMVEFAEWNEKDTAPDSRTHYRNILDVEIPLVKLHVRCNHMATIVEVIAKKFSLDRKWVLKTRLPRGMK